MIIEVDTSSPVPPYEQIRAQFSALIEGGVLGRGARLPPIRQLASDLDLAPGTIARAYRDLESAGLVVADGRRGTSVAINGTAASRRRLIMDAADAYATEAARLGVSAAEAMGAIEAALSRRARR